MPVDDNGKPTDPRALVLEAWAQGYMVGSLIVMAGIAVANMRRGVLLHKLILVELIFGMPHGTFIFANSPGYGWYLSTTAIFLNASWFLHNVIAWMKNKPFLSRKISIMYISAVCLTFPYWILEIYANWAFFNSLPGKDIFRYSRPYEALFRDPPWIFTTVSLFWNIRRRYDFGVIELVRVSPRFGVLLGSMLLSIAFIIVDIVSVTGALASSAPQGINPYWKLAFVFKCLTDTIILDDFKTALDKLSVYRQQRLGSDALGSDFRRQTLESRPGWGGNRGSWNDRKEDPPSSPPSSPPAAVDTHTGLNMREVDKAFLAQRQVKNIDLELGYWNSSGRGTSERGESSRRSAG